MAKQTPSLYFKIGLLICFTVLSIWGQGYKYGLDSADHVVWLPITSFFNNPNLYSQDVFIHSATDGYFPFWRAIAFLIKYFPAEKLFLLSHLVVRFSIFLFFWLLVDFLFKEDYVSLISFSLLLTSKKFLAGFLTYSDSFTHSTFAWLWFIISLYYFFKDDYLFSYIFLGLGANFNPPLGAQLFFFYSLFFLFFADKKIWQSKQFWLGLGFCLILFTPILKYMLLSKTLVSPPIDKAILFSLVKIRIFHHLFPLSWPGNAWLGFFNVILLFLLISSLIKDTILLKKIYAFWLGFMILAFIGTIFTEIFPQLLVIQLIPFRSHKFLVLITFLSSGIYFSETLKPRKGLSMSCKQIAIIFTWALFLVYTKAMWIICLPLFLLLSYQVFSSYAGFTWQHILNIILGFISLLLILRQPNWQEIFREEIQEITFQELGIFLTIVGGLFFYYYWQKYYKQSQFFKIVSFSILILIASFSAVWQYGFQSSAKEEPVKSWSALQIWAKENTPLDSLFIASPRLDLASFRVLSQRSLFFNWKDVTSLLWNPKLAEYWHKIIRKYYGLDTRGEILNYNYMDSYLDRKYLEFNEDKFLNLSLEYGIDYVITDKLRHSKLNFPIAYQNALFYVYQLKK